MTVPDDLTAAALRRATATIGRLRERLAARERADAVPAVAVVGMACRFPGGADDPDRYWDLLRAGRDAVRPLPAQRWAGVDFGDLTDPAFERLPAWAGVVDGVDLFDAEFFGIGADEAAALDPQQRLTLEVCWEALERAGIPIDAAAALRTGVFIGASNQDYLLSLLAARPGISGHVGTGNARGMLANRVSYQFGFTGPGVTVDTACSSSLAAIHLACQSLRAGECDLALAGGVNLILSPLSTTVTGRCLPLAPDGRTKAFDAAADGIVRGEGCGIVVLRRLADAVAADDDIAAVVQATVCNSDGRTNGLTAPSPEAQQRLYTAALDQAGLPAGSVTYIELHGTGTPLGDPIEFAALAAAYGAPDAQPCWLGSVKANIGHLEAAAGVASFVKAVTAIRCGEVPPQIRLRQVNPHIELAGSRFAFPRTVQGWAPDGPRVAAVSSFGFGGTNVHAIVGEPPPRRPPATGPVGEPVLVPVSARSAAALRVQLDAMAALLSRVPAARLRGYAAAAARRRTALPYRAAAAGTSPGAVAAALRRCGTARAAGTVAVAFRYPDAADRPPDLRPWLTDDVAGDVLRGWAAAGQADPRLATVALQAALTARWRAWGVDPFAVCGTGTGRLSAAYVAGVLDRDRLIRLLLADATEPDGTGGPARCRIHPPDATDEMLGAGVLLDIGPAAMPDPCAALEALGRLWVAGGAVDWSAVYPGPVPAVALPTYPWQRSRHWFTVEPPVAPPDGQLLHRLRVHVAEALGLADAAEIDVDRPARDLGVDSVVLVALKNRVEDEFGLPVPVTALLDGASLRELAGRLAPDGLTPQVARSLLERVDELSEAELDRLLAQGRGAA
jgi:acyl transferase domain-containing protein